MKAKDILNKNDDVIEDSCEVCRLHTISYDKLEDVIICPCCKKEKIQLDMVDDFKVIGEFNYYTDDQNIEKLLTYCCLGCGEHFSLKPIPIIYNANHDIYYTGGDEYLTDTVPVISDNVETLIKRYTDRIRNGEKLEPSDLLVWIGYDLNKTLAKWLYDKGYKY